MNDACIKLLLDDGIEKKASKNVSGDDQHIITVNTATKKLIKFLDSRFDKFQFLNYHPQGPLHALATAAGEI